LNTPDLKEEIMNDVIEIGLNSFGEVPLDRGRRLTDAETIRLAVEEAKLAESVGLDIFSIGEHYRSGYTDSAGAVTLAAIASVTERIRLGTSVTVLSTNDPVRLYQQFSTLDAVSNGRAQLVIGRGSATDSFPLFGFDLANYEELFEEKLELFMKLQREDSVTWSGKTRSALVDQSLHPSMSPGGIPTWIGVGGSPDSVIRAARYALPLMIAIIGGAPERFAGHVDLYYRALEQFGHPKLPVGQHSIGLVAATDTEASETWWQAWQPVITAMSRERGFRTPDRAQYEVELADGALFVGSPETVAQKIAKSARALQLSRFDLKYDLLDLPRDARATTIELLGREVAPRVRELLTREPAAA
jgi:probable LLM family oxidoreductase